MKTRLIKVKYNSFRTRRTKGGEDNEINPNDLATAEETEGRRIRKRKRGKKTGDKQVQQKKEAALSCEYLGCHRTKSRSC